jgi:hypothetical protein
MGGGDLARPLCRAGGRLSYAIAAYVITIGTLALYGGLLARERARLARRDSSYERGAGRSSSGPSGSEPSTSVNP